jgi:hypothetical protein
MGMGRATTAPSAGCSRCQGRPSISFDGKPWGWGVPQPHRLPGVADVRAGHPFPSMEGTPPAFRWIPSIAEEMVTDPNWLLPQLSALCALLFDPWGLVEMLATLVLADPCSPLYCPVKIVAIVAMKPILFACLTAVVYRPFHVFTLPFQRKDSQATGIGLYKAFT